MKAYILYDFAGIILKFPGLLLFLESEKVGELMKIRISDGATYEAPSKFGGGIYFS